MGKKIVALLTCIIIIISALCIVPISDAGSTAFNITNQTKTIEVGKTFQIKLNGVKANKIKWKSSNKSIATVSKTGNVKGIKQGKTKITGTYKGIKFVINVTVNESPQNNYVKTIEYKDTVYKVKKPTIKNETGYKYLIVGGNFQNNSSDATYCSNYYNYEVFINDIEAHNGVSYWETDTFIKNGANIETEIHYEVQSGDKVEVNLVQRGTGKSLYTETLTVE